MSQETGHGSHRTVRQIAREVGISKTAVDNIIRHDFILEVLHKD